MPVNYITIDRTKKLGNDLNSMISSFRSHHSILKELKEIMDNMTDGVSYVNIENEFGLPTGKGATVYNLVAGSLAELNADTNFLQLTDWVVPQN